MSHNEGHWQRPPSVDDSKEIQKWGEGVYASLAIVVMADFGTPTYPF